MRDHRRIRFSYPTRRKSFLQNWSVTNWLILINAVFFIFVLLVSLYIKNFLDYVALKPSNFMQGKYLWTLVTSMFMHGGFFHLFVNMFVLFSLGNLCERIIGRKKYLLFYLASGLFAGLAFVLFAYFFGNTEIRAAIFGSPEIPAVGASGAIFAIAGLFMILTPKLRFMIIFLPFFSLPAYLMIPIVLFVTWIVSSSIGVGIGNTAHLGGFLVGVFYGIYLRNKYRRKTQLIARYFSG